MKFLEKISLRLVCMLMLAGLTTSCDWDTSPEYDHPLYVTYTITASALSFNGPEQMLNDIQTWVKENQEAYDRQVNYKTGDASEFSKTDAEAVKKYEEFVPKFKAYLDEMKKKLDGGAYKDDISGDIKAIFTTYAARAQGEGGNLKYDQIEFSYP